MFKSKPKAPCSLQFFILFKDPYICSIGKIVSIKFLMIMLYQNIYFRKPTNLDFNKNCYLHNFQYTKICHSQQISPIEKTNLSDKCLGSVSVEEWPSNLAAIRLDFLGVLDPLCRPGSFPSSEKIIFYIFTNNTYKIMLHFNCSFCDIKRNSSTLLHILSFRFLWIRLCGFYCINSDIYNKIY